MSIDSEHLETLSFISFTSIEDAQRHLDDLGFSTIITPSNALCIPGSSQTDLIYQIGETIRFTSGGIELLLAMQERRMEQTYELSKDKLQRKTGICVQKEQGTYFLREEDGTTIPLSYDDLEHWVNPRDALGRRMQIDFESGSRIRKITFLGNASDTTKQTLPELLPDEIEGTICVAGDRIFLRERQTGTVILLEGSILEAILPQAGGPGGEWVHLNGKIITARVQANETGQNVVTEIMWEDRVREGN